MVKKTGLPIHWDTIAKENLDDIYEFIAEDSESAARYVKKTLALTLFIVG